MEGAVLRCVERVAQARDEGSLRFPWRPLQTLKSAARSSRSPPFPALSPPPRLEWTRPARCPGAWARVGGPYHCCRPWVRGAGRTTGPRAGGGGAACARGAVWRRAGSRCLRPDRAQRSPSPVTGPAARPRPCPTPPGPRPAQCPGCSVGGYLAHLWRF
ncbi:protein tyrosine phosphatase type IVA 2 isoform X3 [Pyrgilauda ruficollis]|uniref:protein tyrosine phosphatase type IVA 2 isoform X3 n=1 Tax=Pyrgilauda ruficollis TaxID=221976 RepID=UPI001B87E72F|nr:protein tyrosine phosphatase type IVA 2 isoform X3 [Pyrgilauda ruficollis]